MKKYFQVPFKLLLVYIREKANDGLDNEYEDKQYCKLKWFHEYSQDTNCVKYPC